MAERQCTNVAAFRFTWPGNAESFVCDNHVPKLRAVAQALGLRLQIIPLDLDIERDNQQCRQQLTVREQNSYDLHS